MRLGAGENMQKKKLHGLYVVPGTAPCQQDTRYCCAAVQLCRLQILDNYLGAGTTYANNT